MVLVSKVNAGREKSFLFFFVTDLVFLSFPKLEHRQVKGQIRGVKSKLPLPGTYSQGCVPTEVQALVYWVPTGAKNTHTPGNSPGEKSSRGGERPNALLGRRELGPAGIYKGQSRRPPTLPTLQRHVPCENRNLQTTRTKVMMNEKKKIICTKRHSRQSRSK